MQIQCPKCETMYQVDEKIIPVDGRKLRCSNCGEVFLFVPPSYEETISQPIPEPVDASEIFIEKSETADEIKDTMPEVHIETTVDDPEKRAEKAVDAIIAKAENEDDIKDIFKRLSEQSEDIFQKEQRQAAPKKLWFKFLRNTGMMSRATRRYVIFLFLIVFCLVAYYFRYEIVRTMPFMEKAYSAIGVKSKILGEGLEFVNINRRDYEDDYIRKMEIKGFIVNNTEKAIILPEIKLEILDKDGDKIQEQNTPAPCVQVEAHGRAAFSAVVTKPSPLSKYIYMTFTEKQPSF